MSQLVSGLLIGFYLVIALYFLRFWMTSRDRLFAMFSAAFGIFTIQRIAIALTADILEQQAPLYLLRLAGFIVIIVAIVDKNRR